MKFLIIFSTFFGGLLASIIYDTRKINTGIDFTEEEQKIYFQYLNGYIDYEGVEKDKWCRDCKRQMYPKEKMKQLLEKEKINSKILVERMQKQKRNSDLIVVSFWVIALVEYFIL